MESSKHPPLFKSIPIQYSCCPTFNKQDRTLSAVYLIDQSTKLSRTSSVNCLDPRAPLASQEGGEIKKKILWAH